MKHAPPAHTGPKPDSKISHRDIDLRALGDREGKLFPGSAGTGECQIQSDASREGFRIKNHPTALSFFHVEAHLALRNESSQARQSGATPAEQIEDEVGGRMESQPANRSPLGKVRSKDQVISSPAMNRFIPEGFRETTRADRQGFDRNFTVEHTMPVRQDLHLLGGALQVDLPREISQVNKRPFKNRRHSLPLSRGGLDRITDRPDENLPVAAEQLSVPDPFRIALPCLKKTEKLYIARPCIGIMAYIQTKRVKLF